MNAFEKSLDMLVAIVILFLIPVLFYAGRSRALRSMSAGAVCENFLKRVSTAGEITLPVWKELEDSLKQFGCDTFGICREYSIWEPGMEPGSVVEQCYVEAKEVLMQQMLKEGSVGLHQGDRLQLVFYIDDFPTVYYDVIRSEGRAE